jgi:CO/xanthine dehydrogenase Mo-binding subunit
MADQTREREYGPRYKLIGKNYVTADLLAKVTGKSKYAEDFRAEGMLFCRLLLSPMPHARVKRIDASEALALPGVKAILTADEAPYGPPVLGKLQHATSAFIKEALQRGAEQFQWQERVARSPKRIGSKVRGVGVSLSCYVGGTTGFDGLLVITPDGRVRFQSGIGNLGTESVIDVHRAGAEVLGIPWERCDVVWGDTSKHFRTRVCPVAARRRMP